MKPSIFVFAFVTLLSTTTSFASESYNPWFNLPGAPALGSSEDQSDYQQMLVFQNTRTADDCKRAKTEVSISLASFYGAPYGPLTSAEVSNWNSFMGNIKLNAFVTITVAKNQWKRPRPFKTHTDLHPCISLESSYSYPSGHSALAEVWARALEVAFPNRAADFAARSLEIAHDRTVGGVHYPSDVRDGNLLGDQIFDDLNANGALEASIHQHSRRHP